MRLPYTNQINQQLPIFPGHWLTLTSIKLHQVYVGNRGDLRAPPNQCQTGSRILQIRIRLNLNSLPPALWSSMVYYGARRYIDPRLLQKGDARPLPFPVSTSTHFESFQRHKKKTQLCLRCCHCWKSLKPFSSVMVTDSLPSLLHDFSKTIRIRCEGFYSFVLFKFKARTL